MKKVKLSDLKNKQVKKANARETLKKLSAETSQVKTETVLPKGNKLEATLQQPETLPGNNGQEQQPETVPETTEIKRRPGRPRKDEQQLPPIPQVDIVTPAINGMIIPLVSKKLKRDAKDLMFTDEEQQMLAKLQPPNDWSKPSWPAYIITAVSTIVIHYFQSSPKQEETRKEPLQEIPLRQQEPEKKEVENVTTGL